MPVETVGVARERTPPGHADVSVKHVRARLALEFRECQLSSQLTASAELRFIKLQAATEIGRTKRHMIESLQHRHVDIVAALGTQNRQSCYEPRPTVDNRLLTIEWE
jgi:hypothetical protein